MTALAELYRRQKTKPYQDPYGVGWEDQGAIAADQGRTAGEATNYGKQGTSEYWNRISTFDPTQAVNRYAQGAWNQTVSGPGGFNDTLGRLKGNAVSGGRLDTGFYDADVGDLYRSTVDDYGNRMMMTAMDATRMQMANNQAIGQFGDTQTERGLDMGVARREELINNAREKAERARRKKRGIGGIIGTVLGGAIGSVVPGIGTAAGAGIGGRLGGSF